MAIIRWLVLAVLFVLVMFLAYLNGTNATFNFYNVATWQAPLALMLFIVFAVGVVCGLLADLSRVFSLRRQVRKLNKQLKQVNAAAEANAATPLPAVVEQPDTTVLPDTSQPDVVIAPGATSAENETNRS
jgi:uncharacterized integral membrane protein